MKGFEKCIECKEHFDLSIMMYTPKGFTCKLCFAGIEVSKDKKVINILDDNGNVIAHADGKKIKKYIEDLKKKTRNEQ